MPVTKIDQVIKAFTTLYPIRISYILSIEYDDVLKNEHSLACRRRIIPGVTLSQLSLIVVCLVILSIGALNHL
jgi:hypothetical protein